MCDGHLWQVIDPNMSFLDVMLLGVSDYPDIRDIVDRDYIAIECPINDNGRINSVLGYNTCVDTIKRLLGIKKFSIQTPYQLYKYLDKHYGR